MGLAQLLKVMPSAYFAHLAHLAQKKKDDVGTVIKKKKKKTS